MSERGREPDADVLRRHFLAVATGTYDSPEWDKLPVSDEVHALQGWLCDNELGDRRFIPSNPELRASLVLRQAA